MFVFVCLFVCVGSSQKTSTVVGITKASFLGGKKLRETKFCAPGASNAKSSFGVRAAAADPNRPVWFPGKAPPEWLDGSLPADFGFDPLGFGK